jgi:hypothetical protein
MFFSFKFYTFAAAQTEAVKLKDPSKVGKEGATRAPVKLAHLYYLLPVDYDRLLNKN